LKNSNRSKKIFLLLFAPALGFLFAFGGCLAEEKKVAPTSPEQEAISPVAQAENEPRESEEESKPPETDAAARVNGVTISRVEFDKSYNGYTQQRGMDPQKITDPERSKQVQREVLDGLITRELLWQEAQKKNFTATDEEVAKAMSSAKSRFPSEDDFRLRLAQMGYTEEAYGKVLLRQLSVRALVEKDIARGISVSDDEIHDYYQSNPQHFKSPEQVHARHILVKVKPEADEATRKEAKKKTEAILKEAKGGADFAELARKHSEGPSGPKGGDLGFFPRGRMVKPFEEAAFALKSGEISGVVETNFGYHIIKVEEKREPQTLAEKDVKERIRQYLYSGKVQNAVQQRVTNLRDEGTVEIFLE
jgi:peptidyl-prolyl cis-trans isomerase C